MQLSASHPSLLLDHQLQGDRVSVSLVLSAAHAGHGAGARDLLVQRLDG